MATIWIGEIKRVGVNTLIRHLIVPYDSNRYNFEKAIYEMFDKTLMTIHKTKDYDLLTREQDQSTHYHDHFYNDNKAFLQIYERFIETVIASHIRENFVYQQVPTFRIQLPNNVAVGEAHRDSEYGHSKHAINFWVPVTATFEENTIHVGDFAPVMNVGEMLIFDGANLLHWNKENTSRFTRISFDFRIVPSRFFEDSEDETINKQRKFKIGSYYKLKEL